MDPVRLGAIIRALRRRRGLRQSDLARATGLGQSTISLIERGHWDALSVRVMQAVCGVLEARFEAEIRWRGGAIDRLMDENHARILGSVLRSLRAHGWDAVPEVTFSHFGERGSIDALAWRLSEAAILVVEVKSQLYSLDRTLRPIDTKTRLAPGSRSPGSDGGRDRSPVCWSSPPRPPRVGEWLTMPRC